MIKITSSVKMRLLLILVALASLTLAERATYHGYKVYQVTPNASQVHLLAQLEGKDGYDFWTSRVIAGKHVLVMVAPEEDAHFRSFLHVNTFRYRIYVHNVQSLLDAERQQQLDIAVPRDGKISFDQYYRHDEINSYLSDLEVQYPNLVTVETLGQSTESRDINLIKISSDSSAGNDVIWIDAGIHAREWIAPAMALFVIQQLVENATNSYLLDGLDWHILPVVNPDGYEFSHTDNRLWRKTRSYDNVTSCYGVDGNRNFAHHWNEGGSSDNPCNLFYHGPTPFSEPETTAIKNHLDSNKERIKLFITVHCFGRLFLYPWGYTDELPLNWEELDAVANLANDAQVAAGGESYDIGQSTQLTGLSSGDSDDYAKGETGIGLAYTIELPGGGMTGFDMPPSQIQGTVTPFFEAFRAFGEYVKGTKNSQAQQ